MADLNPSVYDEITLSESCTFAPDFVISVAEEVSISEWKDIIRGDTRDVSISDSLTLTESATPDIIFTVKAEGLTPVPWLEAYGAFSVRLGDGAKAPVPTLAASGVNVLEENRAPLPTLEASVTCQYIAVGSGKTPVATLEAYGVNVAEGLMPQVTLEASAYCNSVEVSGYAPCCTVAAEVSYDYSAEASGYAPLPKLAAIGWEEIDYIYLRSAYTPLPTLSASVSSDYGVSASGRVPLPSLAATAYLEEVYASGYTPICSLGAYVTAVIPDAYGGGTFPGADIDYNDEVYILKYER